MNAQELEILLAQVSDQQQLVAAAQTRFDLDEANLKRQRSKHLELRTSYHQARRAFVDDSMQKYNRVLCAYCTKIRPTEQMRTCREVGFYYQTDCRYNRWQETYDRSFPICQVCAAGMTFSIEIKEGCPVGKELLDFDRDKYESWFNWGSEHIEMAAKALKITLPRLEN